MSKGSTEQVNKDAADKYEFADPTGQFQGALDQFGNMAQYGQRGMEASLDPDAAFKQFLEQSGALTNLAMGPNAQLTQHLNAITSKQADAGMQNAMTQFQGMGAGRSGAANRAMGEAAANPFADVAAQQQQNQLNLTGNLWGQAFGGAQGLQNTAANLYGGIYDQGMSGMGNMAAQMGGLVAPQYEYQPSNWERFTSGLGQATGFGLKAATVAGGLGWQPFA
jgi:hypothetical protein